MAGGGGAIWTIVASQVASAAIAAGAVAALTGAANGRNNATQAAIGDINQDSGTAYRPSQWANQPMLTSVVVPGSPITTGVVIDDVSGNSSNIDTQQGQDQIFVFDAVIRIEHQQQIQKTQHPVQNGANIADHAFIQPARVELEIGMSDAMDAFYPGQWTGSTSKSVNAFAKLLSLAKARQPLTVNTRLNQYTNMLLVLVAATDSNETCFGLRARAVFEEVFTGTVAQQQVSGNPQKTDATSVGTKNVSPVAPSLLSQHTSTQTSTVPNNGALSSNVVEETGS